MDDSLPVLAADLTWVRVQGRSFGHLVNWDEDSPPTAGQRVMAADGSQRLEGVVTEVRSDGVIVLAFPKHHHEPTQSSPK
jgi:hypothetical protein